METGSDRSVGGHLCKEMRTYLQNFQGFELRWTGREANVAAHLCAKEALVLVRLSITLDVILDFLIDVLQSDVIRQNEQSASTAVLKKEKHIFPALPRIL